MANTVGVAPSEIIDNASAASDEPRPPVRKMPAPTRGKRGEGMTDKEFQELVYIWAADARQYEEEFLQEDRYHSTLYYRGRLPDVDEDDAQEDRSAATLTEVRDTVLGMMPDLLRIFTSSESPVKFEPVASTDPAQFQQNTAAAKQATAYVQHVVLKGDNPDWFVSLHDAFQDALVRKTGFWTWQWEKTTQPSYSTHTGLTEEEAHVLAADDEVTVLESRQYQIPGLEQIQTLYDLKIRRVRKRGRCRVRAVPCENVMIARRATSIERTTLFGWSEDKQVGEFLANEWIDDPSELDDCDMDPTLSDNIETEARRPKIATMVGPADNPQEDPTQRIVKFSEIFITADRDGDGIPELIRVITGGTRYKVLHEEPVDEINFAAICPYLEAHQFFGESVADLTKDVQRIKSRILRDTLDNLAQSVEPQTTVVEGKVNLDDVLNDDTSKIIRQQAPGMVEHLKLPFVGGDSLPMLDYMTKVRENRTGQSDASNGLDPSVLQSSTQTGVEATLTKAQSRGEMVARVFAETGLTRLFRGILHTTIKNQDQERLVTLSGAPALINPKHWDAEMSVSVTLCFGRGSTQQQFAALSAILQKQEQILMQMGPGPIVDLDKYTYTLGKLVELAGWANTQSFFGDTSKLDPTAKQQLTQQLQQAMAAKASAGKTGPDPQIEQMKIQSNERVESGKLQLEALRMRGQMNLELLKQRGNMQLEVLRLMAQHKGEMDQARLDAIVDHAGARLDHHAEMHRTMVDNDTKLAIAKMQPQEPAGGGGE